MSVYIFAGNGGEDESLGWSAFKGQYCDIAAIQGVMANMLGTREATWLQVVDVETLTILSAYVIAPNACKVCGGKGHTVHWLNSVTPQKTMKPVAHNIYCANCEGTGRALGHTWRLE